MFKFFFDKYPDFKIESESKEISFKTYYKNKLPNQLIDFVDNYGLGIYMNGFLRIINPLDYQEVLDKAFDNTGNEIPFGVTAFGDFLLWTGDSIRLVKFKYGQYEIIENGDDMEWFFDMDLADDSYVRDIFEFDLFQETRREKGNLKFDECYGYEPILALGGEESIENTTIVKTKEHLYLISQLVGKLG